MRAGTPPALAPNLDHVLPRIRRLAPEAPGALRHPTPAVGVGGGACPRGRGARHGPTAPAELLLAQTTHRGRRGLRGADRSGVCRGGDEPRAPGRGQRMRHRPRGYARGDDADRAEELCAAGSGRAQPGLLGDPAVIQITPQMRVLVAVAAADFRRGIDGLAQLCRTALGADPFTGTVFVFRNRRGHGPEAVGLRRPGLLALSQAPVERAVPLVAHGRGDPRAAGA